MPFHIEKRTAAHEQVHRQMEHLLASGVWKPGMRLPTTQQLAAEWGTYPLAVHHAFTRLVRRGVLVRRRGHGTFVQEAKKRLACVGLYYEGDALANPERHILRAVHRALLDILGAKGLEYRVWTDHRPEADQGRNWPELRQAAENHDIDALIVPAVDLPHLEWLGKFWSISGRRRWSQWRRPRSP